MAYKITDPSKYGPLKSSLAHLSCGNHPLGGLPINRAAGDSIRNDPRLSIHWLPAQRDEPDFETHATVADLLSPAHVS
jgi:hypothetical protein